VLLHTTTQLILGGGFCIWRSCVGEGAVLYYLILLLFNKRSLLPRHLRP